MGQPNPYDPRYDPANPSAWRPPVGQPDFSGSIQPPVRPRRSGWWTKTKGCAGAAFGTLVILGALGSLGSHNSNSPPSLALHPTAVPSNLREPDPEVIAHQNSYVDDAVTATGMIKNLGGASTPAVTVTINVYDGSKIIGTGKQNLGSMGTGEQRAYAIIIRLASPPDNVNIETTWQWAADQCPPGSIPSPDPSDSTATWCTNPTPSQSPSATGS